MLATAIWCTYDSSLACTRACPQRAGAAAGHARAARSCAAGRAHHELLDGEGVLGAGDAQAQRAAGLVRNDVVLAQVVLQQACYSRVVSAAADEVAQVLDELCGLAAGNGDSVLAQNALPLREADQDGRLAAAHLVLRHADGLAAGLHDGDLDVGAAKVNSHQAGAGAGAQHCEDSGKEPRARRARHSGLDVRQALCWLLRAVRTEALQRERGAASVLRALREQRRAHDCRYARPAGLHNPTRY